MINFHKFKFWLFGKDILNMVMVAGLVWVMQVALTLIFGEQMAPPIGMGYITRSLAAVGAASILVFGSWFIFKMIMGFAASYFENDFKSDIKHLRTCRNPKLEDFYRPIFFLLLYFAFLAVVVGAATAKLS